MNVIELPNFTAGVWQGNNENDFLVGSIGKDGTGVFTDSVYPGGYQNISITDRIYPVYSGNNCFLNRNHQYLSIPLSRPQNGVCIDRDGIWRYLFAMHQIPHSMGYQYNPSHRSEICSIRVDTRGREYVWRITECAVHSSAIPISVFHPDGLATGLCLRPYTSRLRYNNNHQDISDIYLFWDGMLLDVPSIPSTCNDDHVVLESGLVISRPQVEKFYPGFVEDYKFVADVESPGRIHCVHGMKVAGTNYDENLVWICEFNDKSRCFELPLELSTGLNSPQVAISRDGLTLAVNCRDGIVIMDIE